MTSCRPGAGDLADQRIGRERWPAQQLGQRRREATRASTSRSGRQGRSRRQREPGGRGRSLPGSASKSFDNASNPKSVGRSLLQHRRSGDPMTADVLVSTGTCKPDGGTCSAWGPPDAWLAKRERAALALPLLMALFFAWRHRPVAAVRGHEDRTSRARRLDVPGTRRRSRQARLFVVLTV
jgi:hypothetical protein